MARPENEPKTEIAIRLRTVRKALGDEERGAFASSLGIPKSTLGNYERGLTEPTASVIEAYNNIYNVNIVWLITGKGEMFTGRRAPQRQPQKADINLDYLTDALEAIEEGLEQAGKTLTPAKKAELLKTVYGMISDRRTNKSDFIRLIKVA